MASVTRIVPVLLLARLLPAASGQVSESVLDGPHEERPPHQNYVPPPFPQRTSAPYRSRGPGHGSQVNVNAAGLNILNDAANEPSIAIDPTNPSLVCIGWRQFDNIASDFRRAGWAFSRDSGRTWTNAGPLHGGAWRSDPVLASDGNGRFFYNSLQSTVTNCDTSYSDDGGVSWSRPVDTYGGDKAWMAVDAGDGPGRGSIYQYWSADYSCCANGHFTRSLDHGGSYLAPIFMGSSGRRPKWGTLAVGPDSELYVAGSFGELLVSANAWTPGSAPVFRVGADLNFGGFLQYGAAPNPGGLAGQTWIVVDRSDGPRRGWVYALMSVDPSGTDPMDVMMLRSTDGGVSWSRPIRVNADPPAANAWNWFGTLSISPGGRLDVVWNDTRENLNPTMCRLYYRFSVDGGETWSPESVYGDVWNSVAGWPVQNKIGDYYHMVSDATGATLAYAATYTGGQDVYCLRIGPYDCNLNGVDDSQDIATGAADDCNGNGIPDSCDLAGGVSADLNGDGIPDECTACARPAIIVPPRDTLAGTALPVTLTVVATASGGPTYRWRRNGEPLSDGTLPSGLMVSGSATASLRVGPLTSATSGIFDVVVSNACGATTSPEAFVTVNCPADFNRDGGVDGGDVEAFFRAWESGSAAGDLNRDGGTDGSDIEAFFTFWVQGGC